MINLLPPQEKKELSMQKKIKITTILGSLFLVFLVFLAILLFSIKIYILSQIQSQKTTFDLENQIVNTPQIKELEEKIKKTNEEIDKLNAFYKEQITLSQILEKISGVLPAETYLTDFSYQKSQVTIFGYAKTRAKLLEFKKALENQKEIQDLYSPISNLTKPTDIDFYFSFNLTSQ